MKKWVLWLVLLFIMLSCCALCCAGFFYLSTAVAANNPNNDEITMEYYSGNQLATNKVLLIKINGTIVDTRDDAVSFLGGYVYGYDIKQLLYKAAKDKDVKAIMFEINSGGGTVLGSMAIVDGINYYREQTGNPIYAYVRGFAASGAYMVASACDKVIADSGSMTGSIGVIFGTPFKYYDKVTSEGTGSDYVVTQNGIETVYISAGEYKDLGNPYRKMTSEELKSLQDNINIEYDNFVNLVSKNRKISATEIKTKVKALIYGNEQAIALKLIDKAGSYETALDDLTKAANITDYQIQTNKSTDLFSLLFSSYSKTNTKKANLLQNRMLVIYGDPSLYE
jgi:protease-4